MSPTLLLLLAVALGACAAAAVPGAVAVAEEGCPRCDPGACPAEADCPFGLAAPDPCACCPRGVCGLGEGDACFDKRLPLPLRPAAALGLCGEHLVCLLRDDLKPTDEPEAVCVCKERRAVCGTDNRTYDDVCQLRREAAALDAEGGSVGGRASALALKHDGPCASAPMVVSGPADQHSALHSSLALDCEVKGYPTPHISWEFKGVDGTFKILPSDDQSVAVQVRGGPEPFMATSWVQIVDLRPSDAGVYTCVAANGEGRARASAAVSAR